MLLWSGFWPRGECWKINPFPLKQWDVRLNFGSQTRTLLGEHHAFCHSPFTWNKREQINLPSKGKCRLELLEDHMCCGWLWESGDGCDSHFMWMLPMETRMFQFLNKWLLKLGNESKFLWMLHTTTCTTTVIIHDVTHLDWTKASFFKIVTPTHPPPPTTTGSITIPHSCKWSVMVPGKKYVKFFQSVPRTAKLCAQKCCSVCQKCQCD